MMLSDRMMGGLISRTTLMRMGDSGMSPPSEAQYAIFYNMGFV